MRLVRGRLPEFRCVPSSGELARARCPAASTANREREKKIENDGQRAVGGEATEQERRTGVMDGLLTSVDLECLVPRSAAQTCSPGGLGSPSEP